MKRILLASLLLFMISSAYKKGDCPHRYSVCIWDSDYSNGYTLFYRIDADSITVKFLSGGEKEKLLMQEVLTDNQCQMIWHWLSTHDIDNFLSRYENPRVQDGDQKRIEFKVEDKSKTIRISNFYLKDMDEIFDIINKMVSKDFQIGYSHPS